MNNSRFANREFEYDYPNISFSSFCLRFFRVYFWVLARLNSGKGTEEYQELFGGDEGIALIVNDFFLFMAKVLKCQLEPNVFLECLYYPVCHAY